jgi:hypothetical protein
LLTEGAKETKRISSAETAGRRKKAAVTPPPNRPPAPPSAHLSKLIISGNPSPYHRLGIIFLHAAENN